MKIYVFDHGWQGAAICVAESLEEAMKKVKKYDDSFLEENEYVEEYDLTEVVMTSGE